MNLRGLVWLLIFGASLSSCATLKEGFGGKSASRPLLEQILRMRPGYQGLTHKTCVERNWFGECKKEEILEYRLEEKSVRETLVGLAFRCKIAGKRYKIDPVAPGFARYETRGETWFSEGEVVIVDRISVSKTQFLIDSATVCWSEKTYPNGIH